MYDYGMTIEYLLIYYSVQELITQGIKINDFLNDGYFELLQQLNIDIFSYDVTVANLIKFNFTKDYIYNLGRYSIFQLIEGGFTKGDLNAKGIHFLTPTNSYELQISLNSDFTDIFINQDLIINFKNLANGSNISKLLKDGSNKSIKIVYSE